VEQAPRDLIQVVWRAEGGARTIARLKSAFFPAASTGIVFGSPTPLIR